jgi:CIC family chloride channel protein
MSEGIAYLFDDNLRELRASVSGLVQTPIAAEMNFRMFWASCMAALIGVAAGVIAYLLYNLIGLFTNIAFFHEISFTFRSPRTSPLGLWMIVVPVVGGLIVGIMAKYGSSKIRGHGIPEAMEAVLVSKSKIAPRVAILKPISAAIAIGTGGPFGAEGPIIQTGGAVGSLLGQVFHATAAERKVLLACGAAAGMAATFSTPIAAVIIAIELLLFEFRSRSFIPLVIASTMATSMHLLLMGRGPMFHVGQVEYGVPYSLPWYLLLGVVCGFAAVGFTKLLYWVEDSFERMPFDPMWWPAIGALGLGVIGYFVPRVLGVGYDTISDILTTKLALEALLIVMVFKSIALVISLGSGTSGGLLAPMFMASAAMGSAFAMIINHFVPAAHLSPGAFALVAMGAVFGAASRATFAFIIFAFELTRDYNSVLPLMLVCVIADGIGMMFMKTSIMTEKLARRGLHINQDYQADVLMEVNVEEVMDREVPQVPATMKVKELGDLIATRDPRYVRYHAFVVTDEAGKLAGIVTHGDVLRVLGENRDENMNVLDAGARNVVVTYPNELLYDAAGKMLRAGVGRLPVVSREDPKKVVGYLNRSGVLSARLKRMHEEGHREPGWLTAWRKRTETTKTP